MKIIKIKGESISVTGDAYALMTSIENLANAINKLSRKKW